MSIDNAVGSGINKIQDQLDKGKNMLDSKKDIARLNQTVENISANKNQALLELGEFAYFKFRNDKISDKDMVEKCEAIKGFDYLIYENKKRIFEINQSDVAHKCSCGVTISLEDKFCGGCGKKVEIIEEVVDVKECFNCEMEIDRDSKFCPCCGISQNK